MSNGGFGKAFIVQGRALQQSTCIVTWLPTADGFWDVAANWSTGVVPGPIDDICIDVVVNITVAYRQATATIHSLFSAEALHVTGGTLNVATTVQVNNSFSLDGGTLQSATILPSAGGQVLGVTTNNSSRLDGVMLNGELDLATNAACVRIANGLTLNGAIRLRSNGTSLAFEGTQILSGAGTIYFEGTATPPISGATSRRKAPVRSPRARASPWLAGRPRLAALSTVAKP